jgi:hypothetical protein
VSETNLLLMLISDLWPLSFRFRDCGLDCADDSREHSAALTWQEMQPSSSSLGMHREPVEAQARQGGRDAVLPLTGLGADTETASLP